MNKPIPDGWKMFKFEDIGIHVSEKVAPGETDLDRYVGLEHLDSESLRIKRWGSPSDVIGGKLRVRPGDIIFGKRRAYQRKLAIAEFDCICSAHAMVLKANENNIRKDFFPFFLQSNLFMERALEISVGSLSPTINWSALKKQEFLIPSLIVQKSIAEILWTMEKSIWKTKDAIVMTNQYKKILMKHLFMYGSASIKKSKQMKTKQTKIGEISERWKLEKLVDISDEIYRYPTFYGLEHLETGVPVIRGEHIFEDGRISHDWSDYWYVSQDVSKDFPRTILKSGDLVMSVRGSVGRIGIVDEELESSQISPNCIRISLNRKLCLPHFILHYLISSGGKKQINSYKTSTTIETITAGAIRKILVPVPPIEEQNRISSILHNIESLQLIQQHHIRNSEELKKGLIQDLLSGRLCVTT